MVPRLLNRFFDVMQKKIAALTGIKAKLTKKGLAAKVKNLDNSASVTSFLWDKIIFKKFKEAIGGKTLLISTGSAPIDAKVLNEMKVFLSINITEG